MRPALLRRLRGVHGLALDEPPTPLTGGYESDLWRIGDHVVRILPPWRSEAEVRWTVDAVRRCSAEVPEAVAPIPTREGEPALWDGARAVLLLPVVDGAPLDRHEHGAIADAAGILARIHRVPPPSSPRPASRASRPSDRPRRDDPPAIVDPDLDAWACIARDDRSTGMLHGDPWPGNLLCSRGRVTGVVDWDDCDRGPLLPEVAWSLWELCHDDAGTDLDARRVSAFLGGYQAVAGPLTRADRAAIVPLVRQRLRFEIRRSMAMEEAGLDWDDAYRRTEIRAFDVLRDRDLAS